MQPNNKALLQGKTGSKENCKNKAVQWVSLGLMEANKGQKQQMERC